MSEASTQDVLVEQRGSVRWITINRAERRNALNAGVVAAIGEAIAGAEAVEGCLAVVLTGAGDRAFCAGADLQKSTEGFAFAIDYSRPIHYLVDLFRIMRACRLPIIARVNGHVMAGGVGLLCSCDLAVAVDDAMVGTPEAKIGLMPMMILPSMMRVIPERKLLEMCLTAEPWTAAEAKDLGILNYVVPRAELDAKLDWLIGRMTDKSPAALRLGKQGFNAMRDMSIDQALEYAQIMVAVMSSTKDAEEGLTAFAEKRAPVWSGQG